MNPEWSTACVDWADRLKNKTGIIPPPIFKDEADLALSIFRQLRVPDLPGKPTFDECSDEWVFDFVRAIFGGYDSEKRLQLIREYFLMVAKKNTKSTICAGVMLTALIISDYDNEELLILAPTKEVADNAFKPAAAMVRADEELSDMLHVQDHIKTITHRVSMSALKVVAADTDTVSGKKSAKIMIDELWAFGKKPNADAMLMEATGGQVSRDDGWIIYVTTQSDTTPNGVFKEKLDYFRKVRDGEVIDNKSLPIIYEFPRDMVESKAYLLPENFYIPNPNIGRSVNPEWISDKLNKLESMGDGSYQKFIAKHLNIEIGLSLRNDRWTGADYWQRQERKGLSLESIIDRSDVITVGIDGGGLDDLLGLAVVGRDIETREWLVWCRAWAHPSVLERRKSEAARLMDFAKDGDLVLVQRIGDDVEEVADIVKELDDTGLLDKVGVDPAGIGSILDAIIARDVEQEKVVGVSQGWRLGGAIKTCERKLAEGGMVHAAQSIMNWCCGNARVEPRGNSILITKQASGSAKIDPLMALFCAVTLMALNPEGRSGAYDFLSNPLVLR